MEGKNIYLSVFPEFMELLSFCLLKLTKTVDFQVMRVTIMLRKNIARSSCQGVN